MPEASFGTLNAGVTALVASVPAAFSAAVSNCTEPHAAVVAAVIEIAGEVPPLETIGAVPVTPVTPPPPPPPVPEAVHTARVVSYVYVTELDVFANGVDVGENVLTGVCVAACAAVGKIRAMLTA
jgi:hypothetical protein